MKLVSMTLLYYFSDDEAQVLSDPKGTSDYGNNNMHSESKHSVIGTKRPLDSESFSCYM